MRTVDHVDRGVARYGLRAWEEGVLAARRSCLRPRVEETGRTARVDGQHVIFAGLDVPERDHLDQFIAVLIGHVVVFGEVLGDVIEFPAGGIQFGESFRRNRRAEELAGLGKRRTWPRADGAPAVMIDGAMPHHLEVLDVTPAGRIPVVEGLGNAHAFNGRLGHATDGIRRLDAQAVEHRRHQVDGVDILRAQRVLGLHASRPVDDQRIGNAAAVGFTLPAPERRVAGEGPAPRIVVEMLQARPTRPAPPGYPPPCPAGCCATG